MKKSDSAWAAGFFEGEGCVSCYTGTHRFLIITITQADIEPLERFRDAFGGNICGPYNKPNRKTTWRLNLGGLVGVERAYAGMKPWLSKRRIKQFEKAIKAYKAYKLSVRVPQSEKCAAAGHDVYWYSPPDDKRPRLRCRDCAREDQRRRRAEKRVAA